MVAARDEFGEMLRVRVTPVLRQRGFTGGSGRYYLSGDSGHVGSLLLSGNPKRSTPDVFVYDVHVGVTSSHLRLSSELIADPIRSRPSSWSDHDWFDGIGERRLAAGDDPGAHADLLLAKLDAAALPRLTASLTDEGLRTAVDGCPVGMGRGWSRILLDLAQGRIDAARPEVARAVDERGVDDPLAAELLRRLAAAEATGGV